MLIVMRWSTPLIRMIFRLLLTIQKLRVEMAENLSKNMVSDTEISFSKKELDV